MAPFVAVRQNRSKGEKAATEKRRELSLRLYGGLSPKHRLLLCQASNNASSKPTVGIGQIKTPIAALPHSTP
jgi:hypothetical protein